jgi:hypothetical protein
MIGRLSFMKLKNMLARGIIGLSLVIAAGALAKDSACNSGCVNVDMRGTRALGDTDLPPKAGGCSIGIKNGFPVPDPRCTPGAFNPTITVEILTDSDFRTCCIRNLVTDEGEKSQTYGWYGLNHPPITQAVRKFASWTTLFPWN